MSTLLVIHSFTIKVRDMRINFSLKVSISFDLSFVHNTLDNAVFEVTSCTVGAYFDYTFIRIKIRYP